MEYFESKRCALKGGRYSRNSDKIKWFFFFLEISFFLENRELLTVERNNISRVQRYIRKREERILFNIIPKLCVRVLIGNFSIQNEIYSLDRNRIRVSTRPDRIWNLKSRKWGKNYLQTYLKKKNNESMKFYLILASLIKEKKEEKIVNHRLVNWRVSQWGHRLRITVRMVTRLHGAHILYRGRILGTRGQRQHYSQVTVQSHVCTGREGGLQVAVS